MTNDGLQQHADASSQRIDKWLWHARVARTRTLAARLAANGSVRVNRQRVTRASHTVRYGDVLTFMQGERVRILRVVGFAERRGAAAVAATLYEDLSPPPPPKTGDMQGTPVPAPGGRPTKKARRTLDRLAKRASE